MTTATEFLDAFNNSFVNKDSSYLDAIMAENCTMHFTGLHQTMTRRECLDWSESGFCKGCDNYEIIQDTDDSIAGTHGAWGSSEEDGEWTSNCFFFAKKMGGKIDNCGVKGNNTYQIKLRGWRVSVKHGPCKNNSKMGHAVVVAMAHVLAVLHAPKFLADTVTS